ncbi:MULTISPECIES: polysaccharide biosynthesis tyrosine autokinase [unclassified Synechococcus]|uniref:polysaccharide biosynthesis tyrosine autokinase n=1 Tax=unclassified Synechococcus TaxID=2626047 RepID=UPI0012E9D0EC|nr:MULTISPECIES: tyrosine-protein kinase family protein [unclassified Synechococcus]WFN58669.1 chain-length determining protein [Synechococcus sp. CCFWC 502]
MAWLIYQRIYHPVYQGSFNLLISDPISNEKQVGNGSRLDEPGIASVARNIGGSNDIPTLIDVLESEEIMKTVITKLEEKFPGTSEVESFEVEVSQGSGNVSKNKRAKAGGVLQATVSGRSPELVREALRLTQQAYLQWSLEQRRQKLIEGIKFLDKQEPLLESKTVKLQDSLERFRNENNVLLPEQEASANRQQVDALRLKLLEQKSELNRLQEVRKDVSSGKLTASGFSSTAGEPSNQSSVASIGTSLSLDVPNQPLLQEFNKIEQQIAEAKAIYKSDSPFLQNLIAARGQIKPALQRKEIEAVDATIRQLEGSIFATVSQIARVDQRFSAQPALLRQYEDIKNKQMISEENLASYLRTRDQFQLEIAQNTIPWKVIQPAAVIPSPVRPNVRNTLSLGLLFGLFAGTGLALITDKLDNVFHTSNEVVEDLDLPLLGHMPYIELFSKFAEADQFILQDLNSMSTEEFGSQLFRYQESLRNLYTIIKFLNANRPLKSIAITSSIPAEGKSLVIVLLAKTLSELGQRVLLVDADLRKPQLHKRVGLNNLEGLSNLLIEDSPNWQNFVQPVPGFSGWDVITAGRSVPDPPRLLSSLKMSELVHTIAESQLYDLVLYDTPLTLGLSDAVLLAANLDGIMLLVSLGKVDRQLPSETAKRILVSGAPLLGVVTNGRMQRSNRGLGSGYGYGYGKMTSFSRNTESVHDPSIAHQYYTADSTANNNKTQLSKSSAGLSLRSKLRRLGKKIGTFFSG